MNVELINHTHDALNLLLRTKNTRLKYEDDPSQWTEEEKNAHLAYMLDTIKSSWEFVDYTFLIKDVTRAFTHQLVRTRQASYAQQSQRTVDVRGQEVIKPDSFHGDEYLWDDAVQTALDNYSSLIDDGMPVQDARGILPTNMTTDIIAKFNLRTLHEMAKVRLCVRTQGEYQTVFRKMRERVLEVHPWAEPFIQVHCVATGTCAFPRFGKTECKFYDPAMDLDALKQETKIKFWSADELQVAVPVAKSGRTM